MIPLKSDTGCNSVATRAITGVLFGLAVAIVLKSDLRLIYPTFSGAVYIFIHEYLSVTAKVPFFQLFNFVQNLKLICCFNVYFVQSLKLF